MKELLPTKVFRFRGKKYKWTCTWWQAIILLIIAVCGCYAFMMSFFILDLIING